METELYDILTDKKRLIVGLLDGKGSVELVDVSPRLVPKGYTSEFAMVQAARTSFGLGLKDPETDAKLLRYLLVNYHTSPIEMCNATFRLVVPKDILTHFLRHRTGKFNVESLRYHEIKEKSNFYNPLLNENGIRRGMKLNKQSSEVIDNEEQINKIKEKMGKANELTTQIHELYSEMIELGLANEIARFWLPCSEYVTAYIQFDVSNLLKMLTLRVDSHTQMETTEYAKAMLELITPIFPTCVEVLKERMSGMSLMESEIDVIISNKDIKELKSVSEKASLKEKIKRLKIGNVQ
jgi:thymidylate synthase (FAD)